LFDGVGPFRRRRGDNTDVAGIVGALNHTHPGAVTTAVILGAGGTAAAAVAAVRQLGLDQVAVVVRDPARAADLIAAAERIGVRLDIVGWPGLDRLRAADLVVSTVPAGATDELAVGSEAPFRIGQLVFDVVYHPWPTPLARLAQSCGARVVGGLEMLVQQAARQVELMTGKVAPVEAMRRAAHAAVASRTP
jgi:shikimate dehydrogenase